MPIHIANAFICISAFLLMVSCASNEIGQSKDVSQETIYQQYEVTYDENEDKTTAIAQFRFAGSNGTTLVLNTPSNYKFDGQLVKVDSSDFSGAYYKTTVAGQSSIGKHRLVFTDMAKKEYENEFSIVPFKMLELPVNFTLTAPFTVKFVAPQLQDEDYIELSSDNTDSSFTLRYTASDSGNVITIPMEQLTRQKAKAFSLSAMLYRKIRLDNTAKEGGAIRIIQITKPVNIKLKD